MAIFELRREEIVEIPETSFTNEGIQERTDLQRLLLDKIDLLAADLLVITEEFGDWVDSQRRIDILALDRQAKLVVIELKRTQDGGHMELQAIRYAAMISTLTFDQIVETYERYLAKRGRDEQARDEILSFLQWEEPDEEQFANDVRIILVSAEFSKEITTSVMWLNTRDLDIICIRMKPYKLGDKVLLDVQQIIPLPEAEEYQIKVRAKDQKQRSKKPWEPKPLPVIWQELEAQCSGAEFKRAKDIHEWIEAQGLEVGSTTNAFIPFRKSSSVYNRFFFRVTTDGNIELWFQYLAKRTPFSDESLRKELLKSLNAIPNLNIPESKHKGRPILPLKLLLDDTSFTNFTEAFEWAFSVIQAEEDREQTEGK